MEDRNTYRNGIKKWDVKMFPYTSGAGVTPTYFNSDIKASIGCNIKSDIQSVSFKVINPLNQTEIIAFFEIDQITSWDLFGNNIKVNSSDGISYFITFKSIDERNIGDLRLYKIMEGNFIVACGDENL